MNEEQMKYMQGAERAIKEERISVEKLVDMEEAAAKGDQEAIESLKQFSIGETISPALYQAHKATIQGIKEAFEHYDSMRPFIVMLTNAYPKEAPFFHETAGAVIGPISVYMNEYNLQDASTKEKNTHKKSFLAFFAAYLIEWETSDKQDIEAAQLNIWETLKQQGFIKGEAEEVAAEVFDNAKLYAALLYRPGLDELSLLSKRAEMQKHHITGARTVISGGLTIQQEQGIEVTPYKQSKNEQDKEEKLDLVFQKFTSTLSTVAALKLLDICALQLTHQNSHRTSKPNTLVELPLEEYMKLNGIPLTKSSMDKTRRIVKDILEALYSVSFSWEEGNNGKGKEKYHMRVLQKRSEIRNGSIYARFTEDIAEYLIAGYILQYYIPLLKVDERNPSAYRAGKKLLKQYSNLNNQEQGTADIISVKALLASLPEIPSYDEVMKAGMHLEQRIMRALKTALDKLDFIEWEYCNAKKTPLTKKQKANFNYDNFKDCYIKFTPLQGPDMQAKVEARIKKRKQADENRKARAEAKKKKAAE